MPVFGTAWCHAPRFCLPHTTRGRGYLTAAGWFPSFLLTPTTYGCARVPHRTTHTLRLPFTSHTHVLRGTPRAATTYRPLNLDHYALRQRHVGYHLRFTFCCLCARGVFSNTALPSGYCYRTSSMNAKTPAPVLLYRTPLAPPYHALDWPRLHDLASSALTPPQLNACSSTLRAQAARAVARHRMAAPHISWRLSAAERRMLCRTRTTWICWA